MAFLLHIDSAVTGASIAFSDDGTLLLFKSTGEARDSAAWLQVAIRDATRELGRPLSRLDAISVTAGPGSYTGLRVGMASAKGLCYALQKPLITLPTLQVMAAAALYAGAGGLLCPMIDARRQEVFTALYNDALDELQPAHSLVLDESSFAAQLAYGPLTFFGNGSPKWQAQTTHPNARFVAADASARFMPALAATRFRAGTFADLAYCEPFYAKEFYTPVSPKAAGK
ncbi:tRNA threonylcarbamoyladenosine biosynthesis protein TsaB [Flaviaesturariibacter terrae]